LTGLVLRSTSAHVLERGQPPSFAATTLVANAVYSAAVLFIQRAARREGLMNDASAP